MGLADQPHGCPWGHVCEREGFGIGAQRVSPFAQRGLELERVNGLCECDTEDFVVTRFVASFAFELRAGEPSDDDLAYLRERCLACPVSRNLGHVGEKDTVVTVGSEPTRSIFASSIAP